MERIADNLLYFAIMLIVYNLTLHGYLDGLDVVRFIMVYFGISLVTSIARYNLRKD